jgi:hypothetical protein
MRRRYEALGRDELVTIIRRMMAGRYATDEEADGDVERFQTEC